MNQQTPENQNMLVAGPLAEIALFLMEQGEAVERARACNSVRPILNHAPAMAEKLAAGVKYCLTDEDTEVQKSAYAAALLIVQAAPKTAALFMLPLKTTLLSPAPEIIPHAESLRDAIYATSSKAKDVFEKLAIKQAKPQKATPPKPISTRRAAAHSFNFSRS